MSFNHLAKFSAAAAMALLIGGSAIAQWPGGMRERGWGMWNDEGAGHGMMQGPRWGMWRGQGPDWMLDRVEGRLAFIKAELKITEAQLSAWNDLAAQIRTAAKHHNERMRTMLSGTDNVSTLPARIEAHEQFMTTRLEEIKQIKGTLNKLYDILATEQKREADNVVLPMVGMGGPWT
jgi:hypothetical protein